MNIKKNLPGSMRKVRERLWHSIPLRMAFGRSLKQNCSKNQLFPSNLYHRCNETPLSVFIDCVCDKDYNKLVKHGRASKADIARAWEFIYSEYTDISGSASAKALLNLAKDISFHDSKLKAVGLCLKVLQHYPDTRCINVLNGYGYN